MANPDEHPAESAPLDEPTNVFQSILDVHLGAIANSFAEHGRPPITVVISVRCTDAVDDAGNDVANGFRVEVASEDEEGPAIVDSCTRLLRAVRRVYMPELR
jgi:hypothetical protein